MSWLVLHGALRARTALHVGSGQGDGSTDALLRRRASGDLVIPGSTLAGSLRSLATLLSPRLGGRPCRALLAQPASTGPCDCPVCHLFGSEFGPRHDPAVETHESRVWVYDACLSAGALPTIRDGVGHDRADGAAAREESLKFDLEVLPSGAQFDWWLELEHPSEHDELLLSAVLAEWRAGRARVGGRSSRGLGMLELTDLTCSERALSTGPDLMRWLRGDALDAASYPINGWLDDRLHRARQIVSPPNPAVPAARGWIELDLTLRAFGPFLTADPSGSIHSGFDQVPLRENGLPLLPGASIRGALRAHSERLARTLAADAYPSAEGFAAHCPACSPTARAVDAQSGPVPLQSCDASLPPGEVSEQQLCLACRLFGSPRLGSRLSVEDAPLIPPPADRTQHQYKLQDFLAIDRFTGGGRDKAKFNAVLLWRPRFRARLQLDNPQDWELGWLLLALRDLGEGLLPVGSGASKGWGQFTITEWTARYGFLDPADLPDAGPDLLAGARPGLGLYQEVSWSGRGPDSPSSTTWQADSDGPALGALMHRWTEAFRREAKAYTRPEGSTPAPDTYFGQAPSRLYPLPRDALSAILPKEGSHVA